MFRLRTLLMLILLGTTIYLGGPFVLRGMVHHHIHRVLAQAGYPDPHYDLTALSWSHLQIQNLQLEPEGYNTIDSITAYFTPLTLMRGRLRHLDIDHPDFVYADDDATGLKQTPFAWPQLHNLPMDSLAVKNLNIAYAGDDYTLSIGGTMDVLPATDQNQQLLIRLGSNAPELTFTLKGSVTETKDGTQTIDLTIPDFRADIAPLRVSRAHAQLALTHGPQTPLSMNGELIAGALKIQTLPLENVSIVARGSKPDLSVIGNASITGLPQTNVSLRLSEDTARAKLLLQLSGEAPQGLMDLLSPHRHIPLPTQQKFALAFEAEGDTLADLLSPPDQAGAFLYLDSQTPILSATLSCPHAHLPECALTLPPTMLDTPTLHNLVGPFLSDLGIKVSEGHLHLAGSIPGTLHVTSTDLSFAWQDMTFENTAFTLTQGPDGMITTQNARAQILDGTITLADLHLSREANGAGTLIFKDLDLHPLAKLSAIEGLSMRGTLNGTLPFQFVQGEFVATNQATLTSTKGFIRYVPEDYPAFLAGDDARVQTLQRALQNYDFDDLTLTFTGAPDKNIKAQLNAKGRNEKLFPNRPIHLNLNIDGPVAPALRAWIPRIPTTQTEESMVP